MLSLTSFSPCSAFHFRWQQHPSIKWILRVTRHHYQHHHPHCFQKIIWHEIANFVEFLWKFWKYLCLRVLFKIRIMVRLSRFLSWVTIYRFSLLMFLPLSVQSSTCSTLGPASLHVPVLSFCTDLVGELWSFCTESEYLHQSIISGVLRAISTVSVLSCHWLDVNWLLYVFISSKLHQLSKEVWVGQVPRALFLLVCSFPSCSRVQNVFLNFLIVQHSIYKWLSEIEGYRWLAPFDWSSTKKNLVN